MIGILLGGLYPEPACCMSENIRQTVLSTGCPEDVDAFLGSLGSIRVWPQALQGCLDSAEYLGIRLYSNFPEGRRPEWRDSVGQEVVRLALLSNLLIDFYSERSVLIPADGPCTGSRIEGLADPSILLEADEESVVGELAKVSRVAGWSASNVIGEGSLWLFSAREDVLKRMIRAIEALPHTDGFMVHRGLDQIQPLEGRWEDDS